MPDHQRRYLDACEAPLRPAASPFLPLPARRYRSRSPPSAPQAVTRRAGPDSPEARAPPRRRASPDSPEARAAKVRELEREEDEVLRRLRQIQAERETYRSPQDAAHREDRGKGPAGSMPPHPGQEPVFDVQNPTPAEVRDQQSAFAGYVRPSRASLQAEFHNFARGAGINPREVGDVDDQLAALDYFSGQAGVRNRVSKGPAGAAAGVRQGQQDREGPGRQEDREATTAPQQRHRGDSTSTAVVAPTTAAAAGRPEKARTPGWFNNVPACPDLSELGPHSLSPPRGRQRGSPPRNCRPQKPAYKEPYDSDDDGRHLRVINDPSLTTSRAAAAASDTSGYRTTLPSTSGGRPSSHRLAPDAPPLSSLFLARAQGNWREPPGETRHASVPSLVRQQQDAVRVEAEAADLWAARNRANNPSPRRRHNKWVNPHHAGQGGKPGQLEAEEGGLAPQRADPPSPASSTGTPELISDSDDSEDGEEETPPVPLAQASLEELAAQGMGLYLLHKESGNSLTPVYADGNVWYPPDANVPDYDGLFLHCDSGPRRHIAIPLASKTPEHGEDFSQLGGGPPDRLTGLHTSPSDENTRPRRHVLGVTCVVVAARSARSAAALCGSLNYSSRHNSPGDRSRGSPQDQEPFPSNSTLWEGAQGLQPARFRLRVPRRDAQRIERGQRVPSDSNRVAGFVGNHAQYDPEVDNVETPWTTRTEEPPTIAARYFRRPPRSRHLWAAQGFGLIDLAVNQLGIVNHLRENWEQLSRTTTPFLDEEPAEVWILPDLPPRARAVSMVDLSRRTALELGVPTNELCHHMNLHVVDLWSCWGLPRNIPVSRETQSHRQGAAEYARPLRELYQAYEYLAGGAPPDQPAPPPAPCPPSNGLGQGRGPAPPNTNGRAPTQTAPPPGPAADQWSSRATAASVFKNSAAFRKFTTAPTYDNLLLRMDAVVYSNYGTGWARDVEDHATVRLHGPAEAYTAILQMWSRRSALRKGAEFSRVWTVGGPSHPAERKTRAGYLPDAHAEDANEYLRRLLDWCASHPAAEPMGFPYPWDPSRCGCFTIHQVSEFTPLCDGRSPPEPTGTPSPTSSPIATPTASLPESSETPGRRR